METTIDWMVKEDEIDRMDHVNNCIYVTYLEKARKHWYQEAGASKEYLKQRNLGTAVLKLDILYRREAILGEYLKIRTRTARLGKTSFVLEQNIINKNGEIIAHRCGNVFFNLSTCVFKELF